MWQRRHLRRAPTSERGIALIMVLTAVAIFTAVVVDFTYSSRVELDLAANGRDELRAYFMAKSAVNLSRMVLHFQKELDKSPLASGGLGGIPGLGAVGGAGAVGGPGIMQELTKAVGGGGGANPLAGLPGASGINIQLYKLIPIDSGTIQLFLGGAGISGPGDAFDEKGGLKPLPRAEPELALDGDGLPGGIAHNGKGKVKSFGDFSGSYHAEIDDEETKFNVARLDALGQDQQNAALQGLRILGDKRYEWLYDEEDANGSRTSARDLLVNITDYLDVDQTASALNLGAGNNVLIKGTGDENQPYSRYKPSYKPKNAPLDSIDELYMVDGVSDRVMAAFRDRMTVFPDKNHPFNINTDDPFMQLQAIYAVAENPNDPFLQSPLIMQKVMLDLGAAKMFPGMGLTMGQFVAIIEANKIKVNGGLKANLAGNRVISDKSETFTIHASGEVGKAEKKLTAVIRTDSGLGQLMYWREE
jgi:general secretion pathway protein K